MAAQLEFSSIARYRRRMPANQPLWLKAVHRLERAIGEPVEAAVRTDTYFDAVTKINRVRRKAGGVV
jgi:hypothetical protein